MPIKINGSTSGYAQIQAAATAANNTLTLPNGNGMLVGQSTTTAPTNGQIPIGNGTDYTPAAITGGTGISVTNGAGAITLENTGVTSVNTFTGAVQSVLVAGTAQATTSGTSITFSSIPSWVKRITVIYSGVATNGTSNYLIQLGTSGGLKTSGYASGANGGGVGVAQTSATNGFLTTATINTTGDLQSGHAVITNVSGNIWVYSSNLNSVTATGRFQVGGGTVTLASALTQLALTTVSGNTFTAGSVNILYE